MPPSLECDFMTLMQTHTRVSSASHVPSADELVVRPPTELDKLLADVKQCMRQLAAGWIHTTSDEQAYRDWMAWCMQYVRGKLQRLPYIDPRQASLGFSSAIRDMCKAAWEEVREFRTLLRSLADSMHPSMRPCWLRYSGDRSAPDLYHEFVEEVLSYSPMEEKCQPPLNKPSYNNVVNIYTAVERRQVLLPNSTVANDILLSPSPTPDFSDDDRDQARKYLATLAEVLAHWCGDWLPGIYVAKWDLSQTRDDDWIDWCDRYVAAILRRLSLRVLFHSDSERLLRMRARNICSRALDESVLARRAKIHSSLGVYAEI